MTRQATAIRLAKHKKPRDGEQGGLKAGGVLKTPTNSFLAWGRAAPTRHRQAWTGMSFRRFDLTAYARAIMFEQHPPLRVLQRAQKWPAVLGIRPAPLPARPVDSN